MPDSNQHSAQLAQDPPVGLTTVGSGAFSMTFRPLDIVADGERFAIVWLQAGVAGNQPYFATYCPP